MVREMEPLLREIGLEGAPEEMWDMDPESAEKDRQADLDRIYSPEALPYVRETERMLSEDRLERSRR